MPDYRLRAMINGIRLKVCGLTSLVDAELADRAGADYLGFVLYAKSPRHVTPARFRAMVARLPDRRKVAVMVEPSAAELAEAAAAGFDFVQIHFPNDLAPGTVAAWAGVIGRQRLWLAPRLPPAATLPPALLPPGRNLPVRCFPCREVRRIGADGGLDEIPPAPRAVPGEDVDSRRRTEPG